MIEEIRAVVYGKVQMVMFRDFVQRKASGLRLVGTVENKENGTVVVCAQGKKEDLETLIGHLYKGPFLAKVTDVHIEWKEILGEYRGFRIVY